MMPVDITGNWRETGAYLPRIQAREPDLAPGERRAFRQRLRLPAGSYRLAFEYDPRLERQAGLALGHRFDPFDGLSIDGQPRPLSFVPSAGEDGVFHASCEFEAPASGSVSLEMRLGNTRMMRTWLDGGQPWPASSVYRAVAPARPGERLLAHGIPFLASRIDVVHIPAGLALPERRGLRPWDAGMRLECGGAAVKTAHFLGMIHSIDLANGSWYSPKGDHGYSHFVGDQAGQIVVTWDDGATSSVPLVFGFNLWYGRPWDILWHYEPYSEGPGPYGFNCDDSLFCGRPEYRDLIPEGLALVDGIRLMGSRSCNARFIFSLDLAGRPARSITVSGTDELHGHPLISAVTLETASGAPGLEPLPALCADPPNPRITTLPEAGRRAWWPGVERIMRALYTFVDDLPRLSQPAMPPGYFGPSYDFQGLPEAVYAATYLYHNGPECAAYIADSGTTCSSSTARKGTVHYTMGMGVWRAEKPVFDGLEDWFALYRSRAPGTLPGGTNTWERDKPSAWTRGVGELLREAMAFGYDKFVDTYLDWLEDCLFREARPPHWNRIAGHPQFGWSRRLVGDEAEEGNRENDGHGICMWGRYMAWHWKGRPRAWNARRFAATRAAAEWLAWQLDTDVIFPGARKDVLYTESECAHGDYDIYSSYNCLHGLKLSIRMAEQLGEREAVERWTACYHRLRQGILDHLVDQTPDGPVWHTYPGTDWQDHAHKLVPVHLAPDGDTYTPLQDGAAGDAVERRYLEISRNSYQALMKDGDFNFLRMYGYGQGMMAQAALLLDQMADATRLIDRLVRHCYLPNLEGWAGPEGIILHRSGKYYLPVNGYMGQDSHVADSTKALRLMLGVDDNDPDHLRLVPRYPAAWTSMGISDFPALTGSARQRLAYTYTRSGRSQAFSYAFERPVSRLSIRLGPIAGEAPGSGEAPATRALHNGIEVACHTERSGDSWWVWIRDLPGVRAGRVEVIGA
jgi:hypothetical protein